MKFIQMNHNTVVRPAALPSFSTKTVGHPTALPSADTPAQRSFEYLNKTGLHPNECKRAYDYIQKIPLKTKQV
jgi:hypothetical protein